MWGKFFEMSAVGRTALGVAGCMSARSVENQVMDLLTQQLQNTARASRSTTKTETKEEEEKENNMKGVGFGSGGFAGLAVGIGVAVGTAIATKVLENQLKKAKEEEERRMRARREKAKSSKESQPEQSSSEETSSDESSLAISLSEDSSVVSSLSRDSSYEESSYEESSSEDENNMKGSGLGGDFGAAGLAVGLGIALLNYMSTSRNNRFRNDFEWRSRTRTRSDTESSSSEEEKKKLKDVVVIGCGASGAAALGKLIEAGLDVVGLEAADRIGGRIHTVDFAGRVVDLGAAWCHGEVDNVVFELAAPHNLLGRPQGEDDPWFIFSNGTLMPTGNAVTVLKKINKTLHDADKNNTQSISQRIREDVKVGSVLEPGKIPVTEPFVEWVERNSHVGGQDKVRKGKSLKGLAEMHTCTGEYWLHWKGLGYKTILDVLLRKPPYGPNRETPQIQLNKKVTSIRWELETDDDDKTPYVEVRCSDGTTYDTKTVIITVSIGVLKESYTNIFTPGLPSDKVRSINNLGFCVLDKIYVQFAIQWWPTPPATLNIIWKAEDKRQFSADEKWVTEIYALKTVERQPDVLLAWIYGKGAVQMEEKSATEVRAGIEKLMDKVFSMNFEVSRIVSITRSQWAKDKLVRGSYSYRSLNTEMGGGSAADLATPLRHKGQSVVYFAGEAASRKHHNSVHGAVETGIHAANNIIRSIPQRK